MGLELALALIGFFLVIGTFIIKVLNMNSKTPYYPPIGIILGAALALIGIALLFLAMVSSVNSDISSKSFTLLTPDGTITGSGQNNESFGYSSLLIFSSMIFLLVCGLTVVESLRWASWTDRGSRAE